MNARKQETWVSYSYFNNNKIKKQNKRVNDQQHIHSHMCVCISMHVQCTHQHIFADKIPSHQHIFFVSANRFISYYVRVQLLKVLETRKTMLQKEQGMAFARAVAAGFDIDHLPPLISFAECFGASRLM